MVWVLDFAMQRFLLKQRVQKRDNMQGVSLLNKYLNEARAVMAEAHAAYELRLAWPSFTFDLRNEEGGGRPDFLTPNKKLIEVKVSAQPNTFINLNESGNQEWDHIVKFSADLDSGMSVFMGWATREEFFDPAYCKHIAKPNGRGYFKGCIAREDHEWVR